jgi:hypothetical protein
MQLLARRKEQQNRAALDPWTPVHMAAGLAMGLVDAPFLWSMVGAVAYEVGEQVLERSGAGQEFFEVSGPETWSNVAVDLAVFAAGHYLGTRWNRTGRASRG